ncbi:MAG TPA: sulfite exporter TauE/SafE family protein [Patescibacteria group bacterium]
MNQIWLAFLTGLTTGGISCMAVQGGLLATSLSQKTEADITRNERFTQVGIFLAAKILAYTILGALLGAIGSKLILSPILQAWMQIFVGFFMLATAGRLLNLHPVFRYFVIQPPKFVYRFMKNKAKSDSFFTPALLGVMTILIPCGVTQAMMVLAVGTGSAVIGALILFAFVLGTSPVFFTLGVAASSLMKKKAFVYISSIVILVLGVLSINSGQILRGSPHTIQNYYTALVSIFKPTAQAKGSVAGIQNGSQEVVVNVKSSGYTSTVNTLKAGVPVRMKLVTNNTQGCARAFNIPSMGISKVLPQTGTELVEFTPTKAGRLTATCSMGMYTINFNVI